MKHKFQTLNFNIKEVNEEQFTITGVFSTGEPDRHGEIVEQSGWDVKEYLLNPIVLFSHDPFQPSIGQMLSLGYDDEGNLAGVIKFAAEEYDFARTIFNLYKGKYMRAFSVGFMNEEFEYKDDGKGGKILVLKRNRLLEVSAVNIPANALALAKSKGIDVAPLERMAEKLDGRAALSKARQAIDDVLNLDDDEEETKSADDATTVDTPAKATPKARAAKNKTRIYNKAIRALLEQKKIVSK